MSLAQAITGIYPSHQHVQNKSEAPCPVPEEILFAGLWWAGSQICEHTFVPVIRFSATEHDPSEPWIVLGTTQHTTELDEETDFFAWAAERWPANRFTVQLAPWQLSPSRDEP
jgi:hypothetical protein